MQFVQAATPRAAPRGTSVLAVAFGTTVAMWAVGYFGRLPALVLPSPLLLFLFLVCLFAGGWVLGRYAGLGWFHGSLTGLTCGLLNLLVLGSFLTDGSSGTVAPSALIWLPGSILVASILAGVGAQVGDHWFRRDPPYREWSAAFVKVAIAAALLLLAVGGLVTSTGTGLAVVDWPNSFGYNMFLYPFSRMTGGIYYEHAHRLFGALVGLTTLVLAFLLQFGDSRRWVRSVGWSALVMVVIQGVLGGLRVTGRWTLSDAPEVMKPSLLLAAVHGVFGQVFFATLVALGVFTSATWRGGSLPTRRTSVGRDRVLAGILVSLVVGQLVLGAMQRHFSGLLMAHMLVGIAFVMPMAVHAGFRAWGLNEEQPVLRRIGLAIVGAVCLQIALGLGAYVAIGALDAELVNPAIGVAVRTAHQWFGAVLLGLAVMLCCWSFRLLQAK